MKKYSLVVLGLLCLCVSFNFGQETVSIDELKNKFKEKYENKEVVIEGSVAAEKRVDTETEKQYYVQDLDKSASSIQIRTNKLLPEANTNVRIRGLALMDEDSSDIYIQELERNLFLRLGLKDMFLALPTWIKILLSGMMLGFIVMVVVLVIFIKRQKKRAS